MPELNFKINGRGATSGQKEVNKALDSIATKSKSLISSALNPMTAAIAGFVSFKTATGLANIADEYTTMASQLKYVTGTMQDAEYAQGALYDISQKTGTNMKSNAEALVRLSQASEMTNLTTSESIDIIGGLNALMINTGTSGAAATASMVQLTQALASGRLQGDEFRTLMENSPALMRAFAKSMGVGIGQLKQMASDGKITTDVMVGALKGIAEEGKSTFDQLPKTASSGWQRVVNAFEKAWDKINDDTGIMGRVFDGLVNLSHWIENNTPTFSTWIQELTNKMIELWPTIQSVISNFTSGLWNMIKLVYDNWDTISDYFSNIVLFGLEIKEKLSPVFTWLLETMESIFSKSGKVKSFLNVATLGIPAGAAGFAGTLAGGGSLGDAWNAWGESVDEVGGFENVKNFSNSNSSQKNVTINNNFNQSLNRSDVLNITNEQERIYSR